VCLGQLYFDECSPKWNAFIYICATCFDLQGDALVSMYRKCGGASVECAAQEQSLASGEMTWMGGTWY
jgi:hypothetical protein